MFRKKKGHGLCYNYPLLLGFEGISGWSSLAWRSKSCGDEKSVPHVSHLIGSFILSLILVVVFCLSSCSSLFLPWNNSSLLFFLLILERKLMLLCLFIIRYEWLSTKNHNMKLPYNKECHKSNRALPDLCQICRRKHSGAIGVERASILKAKWMHTRWAFMLLQAEN